MQVAIGIDPGINSALAAVTIEAKPRCLLTARYRVGNPRKTEPQTPTEALKRSIQFLAEHGHSVWIAGIEDQYAKKNWRSAMSLAQTAGRWQEACASCSVPFVKIEPAQWQSTTVTPFKRAFGIKGGLDSRLAKNLAVRVADIAGAEPGITQDESDAVCIAVHVARLEFFKGSR